MVALEAQTGRRERPYSSPEPRPPRSPLVETSPGRPSRRTPSRDAAPRPTSDAPAEAGTADPAPPDSPAEPVPPDSPAAPLPPDSPTSGDRHAAGTDPAGPQPPATGRGRAAPATEPTPGRPTGRAADHAAEPTPGRPTEPAAERTPGRAAEPTPGRPTGRASATPTAGPAGATPAAAAGGPATGRVPGEPTGGRPGGEPSAVPAGGGTTGGRVGRVRRGAVPGAEPAAGPRGPGRGHHRRSRPAARTNSMPPAEPELDGTGDPPEPPTRRRALLVALGVTAVASAAALVAGLLSWSPEPADPARPLSPAESERLAAMRVTNLRDVRAGVRASVGTGGARTELVGWVDWARPLVYLEVGGPGAGAERGLVQATASAVVLRPDPAATSTAGPPLVPPADRWRLRDPSPGGAVTAVRDLLLGLGAAQADPPSAEARWLGGNTTDGMPVAILRAPLPADPSGRGADPARQPRLWLDRDARLHRLEGRLPDGRPVTVRLERSDRPTLRPVDALGGRPGLPRPLADGEADRLARLPARLRAAGGATLTLTAPLGPTANLRGAGWLSWAESGAYLAVAEADAAGPRTLLRWRGGRVARAEVPVPGPAAEPPAAPPLPPPAGLAWSAARPPGDELDRLLDAALRAGAGPAPGRSGIRLRGDRLADRTVDVIEVGTGPTALRYWVDRDGLLRRLELRTGRGLWAQLDLSPGRVPALPGAAAPAKAPPKRR
ncbi:hypothetical protein Q2K19_20675 [Micromonospora soli]|uniref:hypothetical protein n=1 Tax=Micromonospora sp. NBRC 110009 TaxID=3061627 RepID=UPI00267324C3|nr:hypothetical protein [Micromonospora sp. NBRC 110009]WKT96614.1 hypothetical protein Q2K19_20675 [Micromonospora sp. NBRC 110009]